MIIGVLFNVRSKYLARNSINSFSKSFETSCHPSHSPRRFTDLDKTNVFSGELVWALRFFFASRSLIYF
jgi:hypothetical protein